MSMERLVVAMDGGILAVEPDGRLLLDGPVLTGSSIQCLAGSPEKPQRLFAGTFDDGLFRSVDGGRHWHRVGSDEITDHLMAVAVSPINPDVIYAGTEPTRVYQSTDGGDTWRALAPLDTLPSASEWSFPPRPQTHHARWIEPHPTDPETLYVGVEAGAFVRTIDGGKTWIDRPNNARRDNHSMATHPEAPDRIYAAAGDGYAESTDAGASWTALQDGLEHRYCWSIAVDPVQPDRRWLSAASGAHRAHNRDRPASYCYRRVGDQSWEPIGQGIPDGEGTSRPVLASPAEETVIALSNRGISLSQDAGETWQSILKEWPESLQGDLARGLVVV